MSGYYRPNSSIFDSDAYGVDTDNPPTPHEILDERLNRQCEIAIRDGFEDWLKETASEYFDTFGWDDDWWNGWREIVRDLTI